MLVLLFFSGDIKKKNSENDWSFTEEFFFFPWSFSELFWPPPHSLTLNLKKNPVYQLSGLSTGSPKKERDWKLIGQDMKLQQPQISKNDIEAD